MALFKISQGASANLDAQAKRQGFCWYTTDESMFYIDVDGSTRKPLNAAAAHSLLLPGTNGSDESHHVTIGSEFDDSIDKLSTNKLIKDYIDSKVSEVIEAGVNMTHRHMSATEGQTHFDFGVRLGAVDTLVYFNGLLLIEGIHYLVGGEDRNYLDLIDWSATSGDICHIVQFKSGGGVFMGGEATATAADIMNGKTVYGNEGELITGAFSLDNEYEEQVEIIDDIDAITQLEDILG